MTTGWLALLLLLSLSVCGAQGEAESVSIAAFNVQVFGTSKFSKPEVVDILSRIVRRYDIILIQEIRDASETVIHLFLERVNADSVADGVVYAMNVSQRLGRTNSKEQYAFMYRVDRVRVVTTHQYNDTQDQFERPPYSVLIQSLSQTTVIPEFFLVGIHVRPDSAFSEINALLPVYELLTGVFQTTRGVLLGDMNADCSWLSQRNYLMLDLITDGRFDWLITTMDTTTNDNDCVYDRIVVSEDLRGSVVNGSAGVFRFDEFYDLTMTETLAVSDHYPVHFSLGGTPLQGSGGQPLTASSALFISIILTLLF